jgi:hypothetical protein
MRSLEDVEGASFALVGAKLTSGVFAGIIDLLYYYTIR